jgi:hypothetical protein
MLRLHPALQLRPLYSPRSWLARSLRACVLWRSDPAALLGAILKFRCLPRARRRSLNFHQRRCVRLKIITLLVGFSAIATGLTFFADSSVPEKTGLNNVSARGLWPIELQYFERPCGSQPEDES